MSFDFATLKVFSWVYLSLFLILHVFLTLMILEPSISRFTDKSKDLLPNRSFLLIGNHILTFVFMTTIIAYSWPTFYQVVYSSLQIMGYLFVVTVVMRLLTIEFRLKTKLKPFLLFADIGFPILSCIYLAFIGFGLGLILIGFPFYFDEQLRVYFAKNYDQYFNAAVLTVSLLVVLNLVSVLSYWVQYKSVNAEISLSLKVGQISSLFFTVGFIYLCYQISEIVMGYSIDAMPDPNLSFSPMVKIVSKTKSGWLDNYYAASQAFIIPILVIVSSMLSMLFSYIKKSTYAVIFSIISLLCMILSILIAVFPFLLPSSHVISHSLSIWDSGSDQSSIQSVLIISTVFLVFLIGSFFNKYSISLKNKDLQPSKLC